MEGDRGGEARTMGAGGVQEAGEERAGSRSSKTMGSGSEIQNTDSFCLFMR